MADAGTPEDAGEPADAGSPAPLDAGPADAGPTDAGPMDAGPTDAGLEGSPPSASLTTPAGAPRGDVAVGLFLFDPDADRLSLDFEFQLNGTWRRASTPSPLTNLTSTPDGTAHELRWQSALDVPGQRATVVLRVVPRDRSRTGPEARTAPFTADNVAQNTSPVVSIDALPPNVIGDQEIGFVLADAEQTTLSASFEYRLSNGAWRPLSLAATPPAQFAASASGLAGSVRWASATDIGTNEDQVQVRVVARDGAGGESAAQSNTFAVRNAVTITARVRISEVSAGASDWFEVVNTGTQPIDLRGWRLAWTKDSGAEGSYAFSTNASASTFLLPAGARLVLTDDAAVPTGSGSITIATQANPVSFEWSPAAPGSLAILDPQGNGADFVRWEGSQAVPPAGLRWQEPRPVYVPRSNVTISRRPGNDTDSALDFCVAPATRTTVNGSCLAGAAGGTVVRLAEISAGAAASGAGQPWVEVVNRGPAIDLRDWTLVTRSEVTVFAQLKVPLVSTGARAVVRGGSSDTPTALFLDGQTGPAILGAGGFVQLRDASGAPHDFVAWGAFANATPPAPLVYAPGSLPGPGSTTTLARVPDTGTAVGAAAWCIAFPTLDAPTTACRPPAQSAGVRITEIADGTIGLGGFFGGWTAFIEIQNTSSAPVSLEDWSIVWTPGGLASEAGFVIAAVTLQPGQRGSFVECDFVNPVQPCVGKVPWGQLGAETGGSVELVDYSGKSVDFVRWGANGAQPAQGTFNGNVTFRAGSTIPEHKSIGRREGAADTNAASDWCVQSPTQSNPNSICE